MSRAFRCDALDTPQGYILKTKISQKNGAMEIWDIWAKMGPFRASGGPEGTQYQVKVRTRTSKASADSFGRFRPFPKTRFGPGTRNGPKSRFCFKDPTIIWENGNLGALVWALFLLGERQKVIFPFRPPGALKTAETARFGPSAVKTEVTAAAAPKCRSFYPLESSGLMKKRPATALFSPKISFHPPTSSC